MAWTLGALLPGSVHRSEQPDARLQREREEQRVLRHHEEGDDDVRSVRHHRGGRCDADRADRPLQRVLLLQR